MKQAPKTHFALSIETEDATGEVMSVYFTFRKGHHGYSKEFAGGAAIADYDAHGFVLGIELIAPCTVKIVDEVAKSEPLAIRSRLKGFLRRSGPRELVATR